MSPEHKFETDRGCIVEIETGIDTTLIVGDAGLIMTVTEAGAPNHLESVGVWAVSVKNRDGHIGTFYFNDMSEADGFEGVINRS